MTRSFSETLHEGYIQTLDIAAMLADEHSAFQHIQIFDTLANGRVMALDGIVQITTGDHTAYSEMLVHVPILARRGQDLDTERVLIVGGGDGAVAAEVLKHRVVTGLDMAEIDGRVVELCRLHFAELNAAAFADRRFRPLVVDGLEHLRALDSEHRYDLIIADRPDPVGPARALFADTFYRAVARALTPQGVAVFQTGVPFFQRDELTATLAQLAATFAHSGVYQTVVPTYTGGYMALTWASDGLRLDGVPPDRLQTAFAAANLATDHYTAHIHAAAFVLPRWMERLVQNRAHPKPRYNRTAGAQNR